MAKSDALIVWTSAICDRLRKLRAARATANNKEKDLIGERKQLDGELDQLGAGESAPILKTRSRYVVVLRAIDFWRDRQRGLADKIDQTIEGADQGKLFDNRDISVKDPAEEDLFYAADGEPEDPRQAKLPVGRPDKPAKDPMAPREEDHPGSANTRRMQAEEASERKAPAVAGQIGKR